MQSNSLKSYHKAAQINLWVALCYLIIAVVASVFERAFPESVFGLEATYWYLVALFMMLISLSFRLIIIAEIMRVNQGGDANAYSSKIENR